MNFPSPTKKQVREALHKSWRTLDDCQRQFGFMGCLEPSTRAEYYALDAASSALSSAINHLDTLIALEQVLDSAEGKEGI